MPATALPIAELRAKYDALGKIEELEGERTFLSRCLTFDDFLRFGPLVASDFAGWRATYPPNLEQAEESNPGLYALILAAWPDAKPRPK